MKSSRLTLEKVFAIKKRERIHRSRRKSLVFGALYGMGSLKQVPDIAAGLVVGDLHAFPVTRIRTGRIKGVPKIH